MWKKWRTLGQPALVLAACFTLFSGVSALTVQTADADVKALGDEFLLRGGDCRQENRLEVGTYRVKERDIPKNCKVVDIKVDGPFQRINLVNAAAVVEVKKNKTTTVTFVDRCRK